MKFGKKEKETQEEEVVRGEIQRVVPDYRVGLNPEQIRIREENGWTNDEVAPPGLTTKEIVHNNIFTYFNLIFLILAILLCLVGSFRNLTFLPVIICNTLIGIIQEIRSKKVLDRLTMLNDFAFHMIQHIMLFQLICNQTKCQFCRINRYVYFF